MAEEKFNPVKEFINLRDSLSKAVENQIKSVAGINVSGFPALDMYETDDAIYIRTIFLNGLKPENLEVSVENQVLTLSGETLDPLHTEDSQVKFLQRELTFGAFSRSVSIPKEVIADEAAASFKKGVLTIKLPKTGSDSSQIINVTHTD